MKNMNTVTKVVLINNLLKDAVEEAGGVVRGEINFPDHVSETLRVTPLFNCHPSPRKRRRAAVRLEEEQRHEDIERQKQLTNLRHERLM
jgi:hypothetical protein